MKREREYNYDLLRVLAMLAVIVIHVSSTWVGGFTAYIAEGGAAASLSNPLSASIYNAVSRFAVPCFIMLSGAFLLDSQRTTDYQAFYKGAFLKIGIPTIVFSLLYILYQLPFLLVGEKKGLGEVLVLVKDVLSGRPYYHMWYLYMLIPLYALAPIIKRFQGSISHASFRKVSYSFLVLASLSHWTTGETYLAWDVGQAFEYLGYFMVGYVLRKDIQKHTLKGPLLIFLGLAIEIIMGLIQYHEMILAGIPEGELRIRIVSPYVPTIVISSVLIFAGFSMLTVGSSKILCKLSELSFLVYLAHAGVWNVIQKAFHLIIGEDFIVQHLNNILWVPLFTLVVLGLSVLLSLIYRPIESKLQKSLARYVSKKAPAR